MNPLLNVSIFLGVPVCLLGFLSMCSTGKLKTTLLIAQWSVLFVQIGFLIAGILTN